MQTTSNVTELAAISKRMRREVIEMITEAKSGHPGGSLSAVELIVTLFFDVMRHDPANPKWKDRDRFILSKGHCCPILYAVMAECGYCPKDQLNTLRKLGSIYQGHPDMRFLPSLEASTGSLGEGLSLGIGMALAAKLDKSPSRTYVMLGDGEIQEGQIWEAAMFAGFKRVDNLVAIVDSNRIQLDGWVRDIMDESPLADKWTSFGWHTIEVEGHDLGALQRAFAEAAALKDQPTVIIAHTVKGKGVSFMENNPKFHGTAPTKEEEVRALAELAQEGTAIMPANIKFELKAGLATREAFGKALAELGGVNPNVVVLDADLSKSTYTAEFGHAFPERFFECGIAEGNMVAIASGLAMGGKIPFASSFSVFLLNKGFEQLRATAAYPNVNLKIVGTHSGISIGEDGPSQMSVEDLSLACSLPGFTVISPADEVATKALVHRAAEVFGPMFIRTGRLKVPVVYAADQVFEIGKAIQLIDGSDVTLIATGLMVAESLRAAETLEAEGVSARVIDMHTIKPLDRDAISHAAAETGAIVVAEEHLLDAGLGVRVAQVVAETHPAVMEFVGINNTYAESATPDQLLDKYGLRAVNVAAAARRALARKR